MPFRYTFKCPVCKTTFQRSLANDVVNNQPPVLPQKLSSQRCWEWQREDGMAARTGCTGVVRWNWVRPVYDPAPVVLTLEEQLCARYKNITYALQRFSNIPANWRPAVRAIIGGAAGPWDRGAHVTDPRGNKAGEPASVGTREFHLDADEEGRVTRGNYNGVFAFYYSPSHAAATYTYKLIVDGNDCPILRGGANHQVAVPPG
jgi:hypothetical protein